MRADFEKQMYDHAQASGVEIVSLLVKDLHGLSADDYAAAMMRQLRVGKLDVGNGAVLVVAAGSKQVGVALGAGVHLEFHDRVDSLKERLQSYADNYDACQTCPTGWSEQFFSAADHIRRDTGAGNGRSASRASGQVSGAPPSPRRKCSKTRPPTIRKLGSGLAQDRARIQGKLVARQPADRDGLRINDVHEEIIGGSAMEMQTADGKRVVLYVNPQVEQMMNRQAGGGGRSYAFVARQKNTDSDSIQFDLLSYDVL
ncbi:MAG: TPM domain-containing protein [Rhodanobacteraceae bacterium]|nr:TPM domain-containing protein [Rhodanobacteraceae bacterium]